MPRLALEHRPFFSQLDEDSFFHWLTSISGVTRVIGTPAGLEVTLRSSKLSQQTLRDLLAIHHRYGLPMRGLAKFQTAANKSWFCSPKAYWHRAVFGKSGV